MTRHEETRQKLVMRYLDGEASPGEAKAAERFLAEEPIFAKEMKAVKQFGTLFKEETSEVVNRVDFSFLADRVLFEAETQRKTSFLERIEEFFQQSLGKASRFWLPGAVVAAAAMAGLFIAQPYTPEGPRNEVIITQVDLADTVKTSFHQTIDDQGTTILWIDDSPEEE